MATDVAQLVVALEARFDRFEKQMRDAGESAERGVDRIERQFRDANPRLNRAGERLGEAIVTGVAQGFGQRLSQALNPTAILERIREIGTELERVQRLAEDTRLGAGNIRGLEFAGIGAGLNVSEITSALRHFSDQSKKTRDDAAELYTALRNIGASFARDFASAPTQAERFNIVIRAMRATTDEVRLAQLSMQAFNTDSERFINLLRSAEGGLDGIRDAARRAGLNIDEHIIARGAEATRAFNAFSAAMNDTLRPAIVNLLPFLEDLGRAFASVTNLAGELYQLTLPVERRTTAFLETQARYLREALDRSESIRASVSSAASEAGGAFAVGQLPVSSGEANNRRELAAVEEEIRKRNRLPPVVIGPRGRFQGRPSLSSSDSSDDSETRTAFDRAIEQQERANAAQRAEVDAIGLTEVARQRLLLVRRLETIAVQANTQAGEDNTAVTDEQRAAIERVAQAYTAAATELDRLRTAQRQSVELQRALGQEAVSSITSLITGTSKLADIVGKLAQRFAEAALQAAVLGQGPLAGLFGTTPTTSGGVGGLIGALFGALTPRAEGGPVSSGSPYLVGERGPELFIPGKSGVILPNAVTRGAGASNVSITMMNDFRGADPGSEARIRMDLQRLRSEIPRITMQTVQQAHSRRYPPFGR